MKRFDLGLQGWRKLNKHEWVQVEFLFPQPPLMPELLIKSLERGDMEWREIYQ